MLAASIGGVKLTSVVEVVSGLSEDLEGTGKVQKVELVVEGKEDIDGLVGSDSGGLVGSHDE